jgi:FkbH-like protein
MELVRTELPEVVCCDSTLPGTWSALERLFSMPNTRQTDEARRRTQMYREQARRDEAVRRTSDYPALMARLSLEASIGPARPSDLDRLVELVQRTNQFNTTSIRYSRGELASMLGSEGCEVMVGELSDKFGHLGVVCLAVVKREDAEATLLNFVMSCRAMGFGMEQLMLSQVVERCAGVPLVGKFVPTARNEPASTLYKAAGFAERAPGEWILPAGTTVDVPRWISVRARDQAAARGPCGDAPRRGAAVNGVRRETSLPARQ